MVVPVLMISCQVSEKPNTGPLAPQMRMTATAITNAVGRPAARAIALEKSPNAFETFDLLSVLAITALPVQHAVM